MLFFLFLFGIISSCQPSERETSWETLPSNRSSSDHVEQSEIESLENKETRRLTELSNMIEEASIQITWLRCSHNLFLEKKNTSDMQNAHKALSILCRLQGIALDTTKYNRPCSRDEDKINLVKLMLVEGEDLWNKIRTRGSQEFSTDAVLLLTNDSHGLTRSADSPIAPSCKTIKHPSTELVSYSPKSSQSQTAEYVENSPKSCELDDDHPEEINFIQAKQIPKN